MPPQVKKSEIWNFFHKISKREAKCNLCSKKYKTSGNTTNLKCHLLHKHHNAFKSIGKNKEMSCSLEQLSPRNLTSTSLNEGSKENDPQKTMSFDDDIIVVDERTIKLEENSLASLGRGGFVACSKETLSRSSSNTSVDVEAQTKRSGLKHSTILESLLHQKSFKEGIGFLYTSLGREGSVTPSRESLSRSSSNTSVDLEAEREPLRLKLSRTLEPILHQKSFEGASLVREDSVTASKESRSRSSSNTSIDVEAQRKLSRLKQPRTLEPILHQKSFTGVGETKESSLTQAILYMICKDNLPLDCTIKKGMKHFLKVAAPLYSPPSESTITRLIENKYESLKVYVSQKLRNTRNLSLTTDIATVMNGTGSFIVLTSHFIDEDISTVSSICLGVKQLQNQHTASHIAENLKSILETWRIQKSNIVSITTDARANMVAAVRSMFPKNLHVPCLAYNINLVVTKSIETVPSFIDIKNKIKAIVSYFRHNTAAMDDLRQEEMKEGKNEGTFLFPIQDVTTWNSMYYSLERFVTLSGHISKILLFPKHNQAPSMTTSNELLVIQEAIALLKPFELATKELLGQRYLTASMVIPICNCIRKNVDIIKPKSSVIMLLKENICMLFNERLGVLEKNELLATATILDPRFKKLHFQSTRTVANIIQKINEEVTKNLKILGNHASSHYLQNIDLLEEVRNVDFWDIHEREAEKNAPNASSLGQGSVSNEVKLYLNQPFLSRKLDPIKFWIGSKNAFPSMYMLAMKYLTINATSVPSERTVSLLNICSEERNSLTSEHLNQVVFLGALNDKFWNL